MASGFTGRARGYSGRVELGSRIAGYLIEEQIGAGGMAVVFRARDEVLGRLAAVKIIAPSAADDEEFRARFLRESRTVAAVHSLHIIPVYGAGEADGLLYIATRFVPGGDLEAVRRRAGGMLAPARAGALVAQVASALDAAHAAGLVHRDVKPQNILVDAVPERAEHAYLSDFGLSKGPSSTGLTATGQFVGTPDYCAPEQIRGGVVDGRADEYALGCVAFVLLTGELLFHRPETMATLYAHVNDPVPPLTGLRPDLSPAVNDVLTRALAKSPADRYDTCGEFAEALQRALAPRTAAAPAGRPWSASGDEPWPAGGGGVSPLANAWQAPQPAGGFVPPAPAPTAPPGPRPQPFGYAQPQQTSQAWDRGAVLQAVMGPSPAAGQWSDGHANTVADANGNAGSTLPPVNGGGRRPPRRRNRARAAVIGGAVAAVLAALLILHGVASSGYSRAAGSLPSSRQPTRPVLAATLTVPDGGHVSEAWFSEDGKLVAGVGNGGARVYVWDTASPQHVATLSIPPIEIDGVRHLGAPQSIAFNQDDTSLTMSMTSVGSAPEDFTENVVDQWNIATGELTGEGEIPSETQNTGVGGSAVLFNSNNSKAVIYDYDDGIIRPAALGPSAVLEPPIKLPGDAPNLATASMSADGRELLYSAGNGLNDVWNFSRERVVAALSYEGYRAVLSPDGADLMEYPTLPKSSDTPVASSPEIWDVATRTNLTPTDPRWNQQQGVFITPAKFSTDGSVIETIRAGGKIDLWDVATHKYLTTITEANFKVTGAAAGPRGSEVAVFGADGSRQVALWKTPLS